MEKVVYLVAYEGGESYETEMREDAHCAHEMERASWRSA